MRDFSRLDADVWQLAETTAESTTGVSSKVARLPRYQGRVCGRGSYDTWNISDMV